MDPLLVLLVLLLHIVQRLWNTNPSGKKNTRSR